MVDAHATLVARALRSYGVPPADLDDGLQLVFMVAARRLDDLEPERERAFLSSTAHNIAFRIRRTRARRHEASAEVSADLPARIDDPERQAAQNQAFNLIWKVLEQVPEELRTIFVLYELDELSTHEIAAALDLPRGTVASRLRRARELFQERLRRTDEAL